MCIDRLFLCCLSFGPFQNQDVDQAHRAEPLLSPSEGAHSFLSDRLSSLAQCVQALWDRVSSCFGGNAEAEMSLIPSFDGKESEKEEDVESEGDVQMLQAMLDLDHKPLLRTKNVKELIVNHNK